MKKILALPTWVFFIFLIIPGISPASITLPICIIWAFIALPLIYFVGIGLYKKLPPAHDLNKNRFVFNLVFVFVYILSLIIAQGIFHVIDNIRHNATLLLVIVPGHFYAGFSIFYSIYFLAKSISTIETKREVKFDEYAGYFFLMLFAPLGIWWILPKVRSILQYEELTQSYISNTTASLTNT